MGRVLLHSQAWEWSLFLTTISFDHQLLSYKPNCSATNTFLLLFLRNAGDRDKVWTFGGGPRQCIGKHLSNTLLKVVYLPILESSSRNWKGLKYNFTFFFVLCKSVNGCLEKSEVMLSCIVWKIKTCAIGESLTYHLGLHLPSVVCEGAHEVLHMGVDPRPSLDLQDSSSFKAQEWRSGCFYQVDSYNMT